MTGDDDRPLVSQLAKWDALARRLGLDGAERTMLLGGRLRGDARDVTTYATEGARERIRLLADLAVLLERVFGDPERERFWARAPNKALADLSPLEAMGSSTQWIRVVVRALEIVG